LVEGGYIPLSGNPPPAKPGHLIVEKGYLIQTLYQYCYQRTYLTGIKFVILGGYHKMREFLNT